MNNTDLTLITRVMRNSYKAGVNPYNSHSTYAPKWEQTWKRQAAYLAEREAKRSERMEAGR